MGFFVSGAQEGSVINGFLAGTLASVKDRVNLAPGFGRRDSQHEEVGLVSHGMLLALIRAL